MNILADKSLAFASVVGNMCEALPKTAVNLSMIKQLARCATSIGANICESEYAQSNADFVSKLSIAQKEAGEARYWLTVLHNMHNIDDAAFSLRTSECEELLRLLAASIKTARRNGEQGQAP